VTTMTRLEERSVECPYCGEAIDVLIDCSLEQQNYIEDCQVCCRPIVFDVTVEDSAVNVCVATDQD
jgi:hypothetical protein